MGFLTSTKTPGEKLKLIWQPDTFFETAGTKDVKRGAQLIILKSGADAAEGFFDSVKVIPVKLSFFIYFILPGFFIGSFFAFIHPLIFSAAGCNEPHISFVDDCACQNDPTISNRNKIMLAIKT